VFSEVENKEKENMEIQTTPHSFVAFRWPTGMAGRLRPHWAPPPHKSRRLAPPGELAFIAFAVVDQHVVRRQLVHDLLLHGFVTRLLPSSTAMAPSLH
jgi:hypothetical protein